MVPENEDEDSLMSEGEEEEVLADEEEEEEEEVGEEKEQGVFVEDIEEYPEGFVLQIRVVFY